MERFEKLAVVTARLATARLRRVEHLHNDLPVFLCHPRQHGRSPRYRSPIDSIKSRFGNPLPDTFAYPSTQPSRTQARALFFSSYFSRTKVAKSLIPNPVAPTLQISTSEGRRLAALALRMGLRRAADAKRHRPGTWYDLSTADLPSEDARMEYNIAVEAAEAAEDRHEAVYYMRSKRAEEVLRAEVALRLASEEPLFQVKPEPVATTPPIPGDAPCPHKVTPAVWAAVPVELRQRVRRTAGRYFVQGDAPDAAVAYGVEQALREKVLSVALVAAEPSLAPAQIERMVEKHWERPTVEAVSATLRDLADEKRRMQEAEAAVAIAIASPHAPPILAEDRAIIAEGAAQHLFSWPGSTPAHSVRQVWESHMADNDC